MVGENIYVIVIIQVVECVYCSFGFDVDVYNWFLFVDGVVFEWFLQEMIFFNWFGIWWQIDVELIGSVRLLFVELIVFG